MPARTRSANYLRKNASPLSPLRQSSSPPPISSLTPALTTITGKLPGRPPVEPYLHGLPTDWQPPETQVAWREEVEEITGDLLDESDPAKLLSEYPLKPHELLREPSYRAFDRFTKMAKRLEGRTVRFGCSTTTAVLRLSRSLSLPTRTTKSE